jgi:hypothetical protein
MNPRYSYKKKNEKARFLLCAFVLPMNRQKKISPTKFTKTQS